MNTYEHDSKITPYNTGKVKIGQFYVPPFEKVTITREDYLWQTVLLNCNKNWYSDIVSTTKAVILNIINK
ncbi:hypothetical protein UFOVP35_41 [uncultured Caudovirales phage]|uniref:Uncharacterized protein n=1 Tax=uncultured Caudovirales phage TaxID=2100421 RepID=A0A6J5KP14_9CAUD|nr:hypothetical protein UFOVP35_41 [uncultured Caudovirales phage]CAB4124402.1 hypothetical protein UFOVP52_6 [uncultured Caudovirales phage]CAB5219824.1 hypothetical protein UFOVP234_31 [uncultured Caudovirales phage]